MTSATARPVIFCSHSSADTPAVERFAARLRADGFEAWLDKWEMSTGDDFVAKINDGLARCSAGLVFFSSSTPESIWVNAEISTLIYRAVQGLRVIPILLDDQARVPPLLEPYLRRHVSEYEAVRDALLGLRDRPALGTLPQRSWAELLIRLTPAGEQIWVQVWCSGDLIAEEKVRRPALLASSYSVFSHAVFSHGGTPSEELLAEQGLAMGRLLFPSASAARVQQVLTERQSGDRVDVVIEAVTELLGLPFEAARLPVPGSPTLIEFEGLTMLRRPPHPPARLAPALPGPLKVLVAIAAPDEGKTQSSVLDIERELDRILTALMALPEHGAQARVLEVAGLAQIEGALTEDQYHVLHLSGHGTAGGIELEDEDGNPHGASAAELAEAIRAADRPLPLVFLSCCDPVTGDEVTERLAVGLTERGVSQVVAMLGSVSDRYATELAALFYEGLATVADAEPTRVLARARRRLELDRRRAKPGDRTPTGRPEYAAATVFCHGRTQPVVAPGAPEPLRLRTPAAPGGPVPQLGIDDLIGRRVEVRAAVRALVDHPGLQRRGGVLLRGVGGVGKSSVAGRVMTRLMAQGWVAAAVAGPLDVQEITTAVRHALDELDDDGARALVTRLGEQADDSLRAGQLVRALREHRLLLVLDNFENNLTPDGESFLDDATREFVRTLLRGAGHGRLMITCRYPLPGLAADLHDITIAPLSRAQARKLVLRLPGLDALGPDEVARVLRMTGGHPRLLELVDAVLRGDPGRLASMADRLDRHAARLGVDLRTGRADLDEATDLALDVQLLDIALTDLLASLPPRPREVLMQAAVSTIPIDTDGLADTLTGAGVEPWTPAHAAAAAQLLVNRSLLTRIGEAEFFVERWTAEGLQRHDDPAAWRERSRRAGQHRLRLLQEHGHVEDAMEAARNFVGSADVDDAADIAAQTARWLSRSGFHITLAAFAAEILSAIPLESLNARILAQFEADANLAIGFTRAAERRWRQVLEVLAALA
jgi:CHAT domain/TIR domain/AAA ATPase domain